MFRVQKWVFNLLSNIIYCLHYQLMQLLEIIVSGVRDFHFVINLHIKVCSQLLKDQFLRVIHLYISVRLTRAKPWARTVRTCSTATSSSSTKDHPEEPRQWEAMEDQLKGRDTETTIENKTRIAPLIVTMLCMTIYENRLTFLFHLITWSVLSFLGVNNLS